MLLPIGRDKSEAQFHSVIVPALIFINILVFLYVLPEGFVLLPVRLPALLVIGFWIVLQFFDEFVSITQHNAQTRNGGVAYMAHIGGFIAGLLLASLSRRRDAFPNTLGEQD